MPEAFLIGFWATVGVVCGFVGISLVIMAILVLLTTLLNAIGGNKQK